MHRLRRTTHHLPATFPNACYSDVAWAKMTAAHDVFARDSVDDVHLAMERKLQDFALVGACHMRVWFDLSHRLVFAQ